MRCSAVLAPRCEGPARHYDVLIHDHTVGAWRPAKRVFCDACAKVAAEYGMRPRPCRDGCGLRHEVAA